MVHLTVLIALMVYSLWKESSVWLIVLVYIKLKQGRDIFDYFFLTINQWIVPYHNFHFLPDPILLLEGKINFLSNTGLHIQVRCLDMNATPPKTCTNSEIPPGLAVTQRDIEWSHNVIWSGHTMRYWILFPSNNRPLALLSSGD